VNYTSFESIKPILFYIKMIVLQPNVKKCILFGHCVLAFKVVYNILK